MQPVERAKARIRLPADNSHLDQVHIWIARIGEAATRQEVAGSFQELLSPEERERAARFRFEALQRSFTVTRGVLRTLLSLYLDRPPASISFYYGKHGKPGLTPQSDLQFNTSHSGEFAVFAVTRGVEVGVDVERHRTLDDLEGLATRFFSAAETEELLALPAEQRHEAFFLCWTRKEAYIKATGEGLSLELASFRVSLQPGQPAKLICLEKGVKAASDWQLHDVQIASGYTGALAYCDAERQVVMHPILNPEELLPT